MSQNQNRSSEQFQDKKYRSRGIFYGILIFLVQLGFMFIYGFQSRFLTRIFQQVRLIQYVGLIVTVIGFGLILCFYAKGSVLGLATAVIAFAINVQLSPLFQKFWYNVFLGDFNQTVPNDPSQTTLMQSQEGNEVQMNMMVMNIAIATTISYLISNLATIGRLGIFQIISSLFVFNIAWPVPYFCNIKIAQQKSPNSSIIDDLGSNYIFVFAAVFGITYSVFLSIRPSDKGKTNAKTSKSASIFSLLGTCFAFVSLPWIGFQFSELVPRQNLRINLSAFNIYFSMIGSIVCTQAFGLLFGRQKLSVEGAIVGMIAGAAISSTIAGLDQTFSGFFAAGCFAGLLCGFWIQVVHPRINRVITFDSLGLLGGVFLSSLFGSLVMAPIFQKIYYDNGWTIISLGVAITDTQTIQFQVVYYFLTIGAAFAGGLISGVIALISREQYNDYKISKVFDTDFGLYQGAERQKNYEQGESAANLQIGGRY